jgi:hypothetical protein
MRQFSITDTGIVVSEPLARIEQLHTDMMCDESAEDESCLYHDAVPDMRDINKDA